MPTLLDCACGKSVRAADEFAGKRVRCPGCAAVLTVPAAPPPAVEPSDDFEVLDDDPSPAPAAPVPPPKPARVKAVVGEEPPAEAPKKKKK